MPLHVSLTVASAPLRWHVHLPCMFMNAWTCTQHVHMRHVCPVGGLSACVLVNVMYVLTCTCVLTCTYLCVSVCLHISSMYLHVCVLACSCIYLCMSMYVCVPVSAMHLYASVPTCTHMCLHEPVCTYMCLCMYVPTCVQCPPALPTNGVPSWDVTENSGVRPNWILSPRRCQGGCFRHCPGLPTGNWAGTSVPGKRPRAAMSPTPSPTQKVGSPALGPWGDTCPPALSSQHTARRTHKPASTKPRRF